jgi:DNA-binding MarR family transcriptional regulator
MVGALLRMPVDAVWGRILSELHEAGFTDLVPAHMSVLRWPGPQGRRPSDLAKQAGMTKQAVNYLLRQLEELGYLERHDDPDDQRSKRIELTKRGRAATENVRRTVRKIEREWERELGADGFAQLRNLLTELNDTALVREHQA